MAAEVNTLYDLRTQGLHYSYESELQRCELKLSGDWQEHKEGSFVFIQHGQPLNNVDWDGQLYSFTPVNDMADDAPIYVKMVSADGVESDPVELKITIKRQPIVSTPRPGSQTPAPTSPGAEPETGLIEIPEQIALTEDFSGALNTNGNNLFPNTINASFRFAHNYQPHYDTRGQYKTQARYQYNKKRSCRKQRNVLDNTKEQLY